VARHRLARRRGGAVGLAWAIREHRGRPGVDWFLGVFAAQATWCFSYGIGLLVTDPTLRAVLEAMTWLGIVWAGITFLGFALEYTGRSDVVRGRPLFGSVVGFGLLSTVLLVTNSLHGAFWTGFEFEPAFGVATVSYAFGPWAYLVVAVETRARRERRLPPRRHPAQLRSTVPPRERRGRAELATTGVRTRCVGAGDRTGPQLQLAAMMFVPHMLLDAYAFNRAEMFDRNPTTSRAAERTAIDDLADPIVALAPDRHRRPAQPRRRVATRCRRRDRSRPPARRVHGSSRPRRRPRAAAEPDGGDSHDDGTRETIAVDDGAARRTYAVSTSPLTDPNGTHVGYTIVFSDVTERERRRQQLEVLNRILRHNLRNDAGVVHGYGEILRNRLEDPELVRMADAIERRAGAGAPRSAKGRHRRAPRRRQRRERRRGRRRVASAIADAHERDPDASVESNPVDGDWTTRVRVDALRAIVENTVENALDHHDGEGSERDDDGGPWVRVSLRREGKERGEGEGDAIDNSRFVLTVEDDGPGIPDHEIEAVESGRETALEHGSGLGLWVVEWGAAAIGADVDYADREPRGTRVTVSIPIVGET